MDALVLQTGGQLCQVNTPQPLRYTGGGPLHYLLGALTSGRGSQEVGMEVMQPVQCVGTRQCPH